MRFVFSEEQEELRRTVRRFLDEKSPPAEVRRLMATPEGYDEAVWKQMAQELGLQSIRLPEEHGGQGFGFVELGIILEEMGRALLCAPFFSTVCLGASAILNAGTPGQQAALLPAIAAGERTATLALVEDGGRWDGGGVALRAARDGDAYRLDGAKMLVVDGHVAGLIVVAAQTDDGIGLFVVAGDADGLTRTPLDAMDLTRKLARLDLAGVHAEALGEPGPAAAAALERTLDEAAILLAAEATGGAQRCLDMAVEYAKTRVQFGRPIGAFQGVKHACAEVLLGVESARNAVYRALWTADGGGDVSLAASMAKAYCSDAYLRAASANIQVHGAIGFTWEHDAHLYFRRAKSSWIMLGDPASHRERVATLLGI